ncbi:MAG: IclR family transcriptional regulator [Hyphomonadaceae bacterium]|nr:IclR family transcriptional regulator [Hyphomonadaceae bacterium]
MNESRSKGVGQVETRPPAAAGTQTLLRGLDLIEAVVDRPSTLMELSDRLGLNRSTVHRLASSLVDRGYLRLNPGEGYALGTKLLELGFAARGRIDIARVARPHLELLSDATGDAVHLGILDGEKALYLDKLAGRRRIEIGSRVGERHPLCHTGLGKSLLLDRSPTQWRQLFEQERNDGKAGVEYEEWRSRMDDYAEGGYSFDLEENEDRIRCVGAPIRDGTDSIVAAISVSSVSQYMSHDRMHELIGVVKQSAESISRELGWTPRAGRSRS